MDRLFKSLLLALAFASATYIPIFAQSSTPTPSPSPTVTTENNSNSTPLVLTPAPEASVETNVAATTTVPAASNAQLVPTPTSFTSPLTTTVITESSPGPLQGTILANRSETVARFFLEGQTYHLAAGQSQGIDLPRATTVINLFNCAGDLAVDTAGCYWDPYLIQQDGFYEIYDASSTGSPVQLTLREAGAPPTGQVWVQNRTGQTEVVVFKDDTFEVEPTSVLELPVVAGVPAILYVRSCLTIGVQAACEWAPKSLDAGVYYAMTEVDTPASQSGSSRTTIDLRPVVGDVIGEEGATGEASASAPSIMCNVVVPALNVRSGPGLEYSIIGKVRSTDGSAVTVNVTGRSEDNEWLTVDESVATGGWINNSPSFITCDSDVVGLPIVEAPAPPPSPSTVEAEPPVVDTSVISQTPVTEVPASEEGVAADPAATPEGATENTGAETSAPAIPDGQALLIVNNGFQHEMRFTLDQMYRPVEGPSEFDLQPGQSIAIVVYPGDIPFTASSPWSGLSGNASLRVEPDQSIPLWLRFEPEQGGNWVFRWN